MTCEIIDLDELKKNSDDSYKKLYNFIRKSSLVFNEQQELFRIVAEYLDSEIELEKVCN